MSVKTIGAKNNTRQNKRERGSGCLIPPRPGVTRYWTGQVYDINGKLVRRSLRAADGSKISGELRKNGNPKDLKDWTNVTAARLALDKLRGNANEGTIAVGADPSQLHYGDLRKMYLDASREGKHKSLLTNAETGEEYVCGLNHLDEFFGWTKEGDDGAKISTITSSARDRFVAKQQAAGAANGTVNRSLSALTRMFELAREVGKIQTAPLIKKLPEPRQPKQGFLDVSDYEKLRKTLPEYVRPILQMGYYTGMRLGEILALAWDRVDLGENMIRLQSQDVKNKEARIVPLIDGLPKTLESIRRKNPKAELVFFGVAGAPISSFRKAWAKSCIASAIETTLYGVKVVSHLSKGPQCCTFCKEAFAGKILGVQPTKMRAGKYIGFTFHDLRRTAIRNLVRAGVSRSVAKAISGHKTEAVFERYNITSEADLRDAGAAVSDYLKNQKRLAAARPDPMRRRLRAVR